MKKSFRTVVAGVVITASLGFSGAAFPAQAQVTGLRFYEDDDFKGEVKSYYATQWYLWEWNHWASSVRNSDDVAWVLYDDWDYADRRFCLRSGEEVKRLGDEQWRFNDKTSSIRRLSTNSCAGYPAFYSIS
ncbi:hypothetical protein GCM10010517_70920 [Streptosporangium fragile]|uniref:Beta/gamma crystallin 'Greek key' domain-containing protein n=1 Tax=Streptosporangium fragile TaxID=46186 RepID=A0ABN3W7V0_9ACTN